MEITLEQLLAGKATRIRNKQFFSTAQYVEPFLERMSSLTNDFRVQVKLPDQITITDGEISTDDITYNRVYIQAVLPDSVCFENHNDVIGMVYGIDTRKPIVKMFKGALNCACTNLCVFNPESLYLQEIAPDSPIDFRPLSRIVDQTSQVAQYLTSLRDREFNCSPENIQRTLGKWIQNLLYKSFDAGFGRIKLATDTAVDAYKLLFVDKSSPYYVTRETTTMFNIYNAFTQLITDNRPKEIMNECEKTLLLRGILEF